MGKNLTPELKSYKEEFDFLYKKLGELEWEFVTLSHDRKTFLQSEIDMLEDQIENYRVNIGILVEKVKNEVTRVNKSE